MSKEYIPVPFERYEELLIIEARFTSIKTLADMPIKEEEDDEFERETD